VTSRRTRRSHAEFTPEHLDRLSSIALADHDYFTRPAGRPEFADRRLAVVLAQGGALHYLYGAGGVKDLDVWTFYAALPGVRFPAKRHRHVDFGPSEFGRQRYDFAGITSAAELARLRRWDQFEGRRVDLLMRDLPVGPGAAPREVVEAIRKWLATDCRSTANRRPSSWHLAQKAVVMIDPKRRRGTTVWPMTS
jgi:hypothetical protein